MVELVLSMTASRAILRDYPIGAAPLMWLPRITPPAPTNDRPSGALREVMRSTSIHFLLRRRSSAVEWCRER